MGNFDVAIFLSEDKDFEEMYAQVITEDDLLDFEYTIETSQKFKETYIPFHETYVKWFFNNNQKIQKIENIIGFIPKSPAATSCYSSIFQKSVISCKDYLERLDIAKFSKKFERYIIPAAFVFGPIYYENINDVSYTYEEISQDFDKHTFKLKMNKRQGNYSDLFLKTLKDNPDRLLVMCNCHT